MSMLRLDLFRWVVSRCLLSALFIAIVLPATACGRISIFVHGQASGQVRFHNTGSPNWQISATDTDELVQTARLEDFRFNDREFRVFLDDGSFLITTTRLFDVGWAFAIGLFDEAGDPQLFFQMRAAFFEELKPTVLDDSLAKEFVDAGLWTDVDDYIEFGCCVDGFASVEPIPTGPDDYFGVGPEPSTFVLAMLALLSAVATFRRNRKR